jgi:hypothetical protein
MPSRGRIAASSAFASGVRFRLLGQVGHRELSAERAEAGRSHA